MTILLLVFVFLSILALFRSFKYKDEGQYSSLLRCAFILRLILLFITCLDVVALPDAHQDADIFHETAVGNQTSITNDYWTNYTVFLTILYSFTDCSRWFAQYINVLFGMAMLLYVRKMLRILNVEKKKGQVVMGIMAFMPFLNLYSVVLMREAWIGFFLTISLYHFICWYLMKGKGAYRMILCLSSVICAMWMHAGCVGFLFGYCMAFLVYKRKDDVVKISYSSYISLFFILIIGLFMFLNMDTLGEKLLGADMDYIQEKNAGAGGGSDYLTWIDLSSPLQLIVFSPLKILYFLFSPMIMDWRGINDIAASALDGIVYVYACWRMIRYRVEEPRYNFLKKILFISIFSTVFIFSFGTSNSGTAIRHRAKICSAFLIISAISSNKEKKRNSSNYLLNKNTLCENPIM